MSPNLANFLNAAVKRFNEPGFVEDDPISIPHRFTKLQDVEITAFWVSMLAWGQRKTIINSANRLIDCMDGAPHDFILNHEEKDRARFADFKHRTFQYTDTLYFLEFLQWYYRQEDSLENAFSRHLKAEDVSYWSSFDRFSRFCFLVWPDAPHRTRKHIATPARKSSCKRFEYVFALDGTQR